MSLRGAQRRGNPADSLTPFIRHPELGSGSHSTLIEMLKQVQHDILSKGTVRPCILSQNTHARSLFTNEFHSFVSAFADNIL